MTKTAQWCLVVLLIGIIVSPLWAQSKADLNGEWEMIPAKSSKVALYRTMGLEFQVDDAATTIIHQWGRRRGFQDTVTVKTDGSVNTVTIPHRVFPSNVFMGLSKKAGSDRNMKATWDDNGQVLTIHEEYTLYGSQGATPVTTIHTYRYSPKYETVTYTIDRSTRTTGPAVEYVLKRKGTKQAYYMTLEDDWAIDGKLEEQAFVISLQGLANADAPQLYFIYPETWDFRFTPDVFDFLTNERNFTFKELRSIQQALNIFKDQVDGYVVWDKEERTSLIVSFTVAGLENAVVVSEDLIPLVEEAGLKPVEDFRGQFSGWSDVEIYQWAYDRYWDRTSKEYIVWMGGHSGRIMKPGVADWGIYKNAFFNDLSTKPSDEAEYALADKMLSEMEPYSYVFGWHSYAKDKERDHVTLTSSHGLRVEGLHTLPNMSFSSQIPPTPGFEFENNHNIEPGKRYTPGNKVYVACIQTDCLGLGAWTRPGRGEIPYAWEVTMNWSWLAPAMMEFFYTQATPNDLFIGSLSGPGYMYPKAVPPEKLPHLIDIAYDLMQKLDLNVFEIMDYSEGATVEGNTELTEQVVDAYYEGMPDVIGFANGYAPAFTFTSRDGVPLISFDYYLSPERSENDAVADLIELGAINSKRPYFLLMHVRQWSDISRVKDILDRLPEEYELLPLDVFMKMAGQQPTFEEQFLEK